MIKQEQSGFDPASAKDRALALTPVSRETRNASSRFVDPAVALAAKSINLVAASTLPRSGHGMSPIRSAPGFGAESAEVWVDFGSGGGFPGIPSPARWPASGARWCISLKAWVKRPISCARSCGQSGLPAQVRHDAGREIWRKLCRSRRRRHGPRALAAENPCAIRRFR